MSRPDDFDRERRRIIRQVSLLTWGLAAAAVLLAVGGGAFLAWLFIGAGWPFRRTWAIMTVLLLVIPAAVNLVQRLKQDDDSDHLNGTEEGRHG